MINVASPSNKNSKAANQKEAKKNNTVALKFLLDGPLVSIQESLGEFTSTKELWLKLEADYQGKLQGKQVEEEKEQEQDIHEHKGMNLVYQSPLFDKIDKAIVKYDIDLSTIRKDLEELLSKATSSTDCFSYTHAKVSYNDLKDIKRHIEVSFGWYQKKATNLSNLLKVIKDECITLHEQLNEKKEEVENPKSEFEEEIDNLKVDNVNLRLQLEEARRKEEGLKDQLDEKDKYFQMLEMEVVELRKKADQSEAHEKFKIYSSVLDEILEIQRSPFDKTGLGYSKTMKEDEEGPSCSIFAPFVPTQNKEEVRLGVRNKPIAGPPPQDRFIREPAPKYVQRNRYDSVFHGYCFSCNEYGHRAIDCTRYVRRDVGRLNTQIRCWTCGLLGHVASVCHTMRCYSGDGLGHRSRDCWYSRRQPMRNGSTRRIDEPWRRTNSGIGSHQKTTVAE